MVLTNGFFCDRIKTKNALQRNQKMAKRRMLSIPIVETDRFYELKSTEQALYLHLNLNADDDGVVDRVKSIMRDTHASTKNYQSLVDGGYIIDLGKGLALITHWNQHNKIKKDRYIPSVYHDIISKMELDPNGRYIKASEVVFGDICAPQDSIGKVSTDKGSIAKESEDKGKEEKESNNLSFLHTFKTEEDLKISSDSGFAEEPTGAEIDHNRFLAKLKLYFIKRYKSINCNDFIEHYDRVGWIGENGESVKDNFVLYLEKWYGQ